MASLACGVAPNAGTLVAARFVQGVGAAAMFATVFPLLNSNYSGRDRGTAYGMWGAVAGASAAIGPILGGVLTQGVNWRWIFFVNLPVSVVAIGFCLRAIKDAEVRSNRRVDLLGIVTFTAAAASLTYGLIRSNEDGWGEPASWLWLVATPVLVAVFIAVEVRTDQPMLDLSLLRTPSFVGVLLAGLVLTLSAFSALTYVSIWLQSVLGLSPIQAGLTGLPLSLVAFVIPASLGRVLHHRRPGPVLGGGLLLIGLGGVVGALVVHGSAGWAALIPGYVLIGLGVGMATPVLGSAATAAVEPQRAGMAAGALNTFRQLGFALGIAVLGSVFSARAASVLTERGAPSPDGIARAVAGGQAQRVIASVPGAARDAVDSAVHAAAIGGVQAALLVSGVLGVLSGLVVLRLMRDPQRATEAGADGATGAAPARSVPEPA